LLAGAGTNPIGIDRKLLKPLISPMKNTKNKAAKKTNKGLAHITTWIKPTAKNAIKEIGKREHRTLASQTRHVLEAYAQDHQVAV
jgi:hypothetical protein